MKNTSKFVTFDFSLQQCENLPTTSNSTLQPCSIILSIGSCILPPLFWDQPFSHYFKQSFISTAPRIEPVMYKTVSAKCWNLQYLITFLLSYLIDLFLCAAFWCLILRQWMSSRTNVVHWSDIYKRNRVGSTDWRSTQCFIYLFILFYFIFKLM